ncbi:MORN repeat-containing protein 4-like isoform X2 [Phymastichus coffea]|uniref:MORN repeat-containing protein 4-like isoform X2 n=1 Tax=Phymastichus coffea TaxID=108790 RepID=UPI00273CF14E|nr:MORN repeat-containing protein 4-like isoform X2 [Phymastichus coffea]
MEDGVMKLGTYKYEDGTRYIGEWNNKGLKNGAGSLILPEGTRYDGSFQNGLCSGLGIFLFPDGAKYEGEFMQGWFHGHGVFWRSDGMKFEGEFRGGRIWGLGKITYNTSPDINKQPRTQHVKESDSGLEDGRSLSIGEDCSSQSSAVPAVSLRTKEVAMFTRNLFKNSKNAAKDEQENEMDEEANKMTEYFSNFGTKTTTITEGVTD